jgi:biopolymer transport protein TolR
VLDYNQFLRKNKKKKAIDTINVTPLVDVMLVLLIIFMVTSPMMIAGIKVDLPKTQSSPLSGKEDPLSITVTKTGNVFLNNSPIPIENLVTKLKAITNENYNITIFVRGDRNADYGSVIKIIALLSKSGFSKVSLITEID